MGEVPLEARRNTASGKRDIQGNPGDPGRNQSGRGGAASRTERGVSQSVGGVSGVSGVKTQGWPRPPRAKHRNIKARAGWRQARDG